MARSLERWDRSVVDVLFPITSGLVVAALATALDARAESYASDVSVSRVLPPALERTARMVTVRDDGGPKDGIQSRRQLGFNVWAETSVAAEQLALLCMALVEAMPDGQPITFVDNVSGPFDVVDDSTDLLVVDGTTLSHFFFTARVSVRGVDL